MFQVGFYDSKRNWWSICRSRKAFLKLELLEEKPIIGVYFGIITNVECLTPYYSYKSSYIYEGNIFDNGQAYMW